MANIGHRVTGIDIDQDLINRLRDGKSRIYENDLEIRLKNVLERGTLTFDESVIYKSNASIFIISVGVNDRPNGTAELSQLEFVAVYTVGSTAMLHAKLLFDIPTYLIDLSDEKNFHRSTYKKYEYLAQRYKIPKIPPLIYR